MERIGHEKKGDKRMEMYGEFYCINGGYRYPFEGSKLQQFVETVLRIERYEATFFRIPPEEFQYEGVMDERYDTYTVTENWTKHLSEHVFYDMILETEEGVILRILHEYYDEEYYGICLMVSIEQLKERFMKIQAIKYLEQMEKAFYDIMAPRYRASGVEAFLEELHDEENK